MTTVINQSYRFGLRGISESQRHDGRWLDTMALEQTSFNHLKRDDCVCVELLPIRTLNVRINNCTVHFLGGFFHSVLEKLSSYKGL
jgi:hypothetical protein